MERTFQILIRIIENPNTYHASERIRVFAFRSVVNLRVESRRHLKSAFPQPVMALIRESTLTSHAVPYNILSCKLWVRTCAVLAQGTFALA